jgi:hypothetical protein
MNARTAGPRRGGLRMLILVLGVAATITLLVAGPAFAVPAPVTEGQQSGSVTVASALPADIDQTLLADYGLTPTQLLQISDGYPDGTWRPYAEVTRAEYAKLVVRAFGLSPLVPADPTFADVPASHPLYGYVEAAAAGGMVKGRGEGLFAPDASITRQEAAAIVVRYLVKTNGRDLATIMPDDLMTAQLSLYPDGGNVSPALKREVATAIARLALKGTADGGPPLLHPTDPVTRIQAAAVSLRQEKPGLTSMVGGGGVAIVLKLLRMVLDNVVITATCHGFDAASSALFGDKEWAEVQDQLEQVQDSIDQVNAGLNQIKSQLDDLSALFSQEFAKIKAAFIESGGDAATSTIQSWYSGAATDSYAYFTGLYTDPPANPVPVQEDLLSFEEALLDPGTDNVSLLVDKIYHTILPDNPVYTGILSQWIDWACAGGVTADEVMDGYVSMETYFAELVANQLEGVQLCVEALNARDERDGIPNDTGMVNGPSANAYLADQWLPELKAEVDEFLGETVRYVLHYARNLNSFTPDLLGDSTLESILARANFVCSTIDEQRVIFADGSCTGDPQNAYGLQSIVIYPTALAAHTSSMYATRTGGLVDYKALSSEEKCTINGPKTAVFNTGTPATLDIDAGYTVRRLNWGPIPVALYPGKAFSIHDFTRSSVGSQYYDHGDITLGYMNGDYTTATGPADGVYLYACKIVSYQYFSGTESDVTWYQPRSLGNGWTLTSSDSPSSGWLQVATSTDGNSQVLFPSQVINMKGSLPSGQMAWTYETGLPQFKFIGPTGTTMDFTVWSSAGEDPSVVLADGSIVSDRNGSGGWQAALALRDNSGAQLQSTSMNSTTNGRASLPTVTLTNGQTYGFFGVNHADYKASGIGNYTLYMTSRCDFNHIDIVVP